jgi:prepilin-type N-terminal cleavage/methylation domain-containing protein
MKKRGFTKGFTLVELMVTITIMLIMTAVVFFNYNSFNDSSLLSAFAYDMSLTIRQAQVYGVATREGNSTSQSGQITTASIGSGNFSYPYGVHFDKNSTTAPLVLFIDVNKDGKYVLGDDGQPLQSYTFQRGIKIYQLCVTDTTEHCDVNALDITFKRPDPEAIVSAFDMSSSRIYPSSSSARIVLHNSGDSLTKSVAVYSTGQISVQ